MDTFIIALYSNNLTVKKEVLSSISLKQNKTSIHTWALWPHHHPPMPASVSGEKLAHGFPLLQGTPQAPRPA